MPDKLHIILAGEQSRTRSFVCSKPILRNGLLISLAALLALFVLSTAGVRYARENITLRSSLAELNRELKASKSWNSEFEQRLTREVAAKEARLQKRLNDLIEENNTKKARLDKALAELKSRSEDIEAILKTVGIKVTARSNTNNSGGPFIPLSDKSYDDLTFKVDNYLDTLQAMPLGPPVWGTITSKYGRRVDPMNNKAAFHSGIDIRKHLGAKVKSTANGVVKEQGYTKGNGNYVIIKHAHGFVTKYLHLQKRLVKKGQKVVRGQIIGLVGNTGRSTGAHLHYEIVYKGRTVNPLKFVRIARYLSKRSGNG